MRLPHLQHHQDRIIHLEDASSHRVAGLQTRSLSSWLPSASHGNSAMANHPKIIPGISNQTKMYKNSLASAMYADVLASKLQSAGPNCRQVADVTSLMVRLRNPSTGLSQDHIIRGTSEGAICMD